MEGSDSHHPLLAEHYGWELFLTCSGRMQARSPEHFERFERLWIPMEEHYFCTFRIAGHSDLVLDTGAARQAVQNQNRSEN